MIKCMDCGAEFESARPMTEPHGEVLYNCPNCLGLEIKDVSEILCEACGEHAVDHNSDRWCYECRMATKEYMQDVIIKSMRDSSLNMATIVNSIEDIITGADIYKKPNSLVADNLVKGIAEIAYTCGCSLYMAEEMVEAWASGTLD